MALLAGLAAPVYAEGPTYDVIIRGGTVIDGTGSPGFAADVAIKDGHIAFVGSIPAEYTAARMINARGLVVAPGFIDLHAHSDSFIKGNTALLSGLRQGITLQVNGQDGRSRLDIGNYLSELEQIGPIGINQATLLGEGYVRLKVVGQRSKITAEELEDMKSRVARAMAEGAFGMSTSLTYYYNSPATVYELVELAKVVKSYGGYYSTHTRNEAEGIVASVTEALRIGKESGIPVDISHFKVMYPANYTKQGEALSLVHDAAAAGQKLIMDAYPYLAPDFSVNWALVDSYTKYPAETIYLKQVPGGFRSFQGMTLADAANAAGKTPALLAQEMLAVDSDVRVGVEIISRSNLLEVLGDPLTVIGSDAGSAPRYSDAEALSVHPRTYGAFPTVLGPMVRDEQLFTLEVAVRKMTGQTAEWLGLRDRGLLRPGYWADVTVFDPATVNSSASLVDAQRDPVGVQYVLVNGVLSIDNGEYTGSLGGKVLRHNELADPVDPGALNPVMPVVEPEKPAVEPAAPQPPADPGNQAGDRAPLHPAVYVAPGIALAAVVFVWVLASRRAARRRRRRYYAGRR
jgi:N-acyl-D-aspartate/D-glutamate deacylase